MTVRQVNTSKHNPKTEDAALTALKNRLGWLISLIGLIVLLTGCKAARHVEEGKYLLRNEVTIRKGIFEQADSAEGGTLKFKDEGAPSLESAEEAILTRPNRRWLIPKTYLHLYNTGKNLTTYEYPFETTYRKLAGVFSFDPGLVDTLGNLLITIGEEPVVVDSQKVERDIKNLKSVYFAHGWFDPEIRFEIDTSRYPKKKADVIIEVEEGTAWIIDTMEYRITDPYVAEMLERTKQASKLKEGDLYDEEKMEAERTRVAKVMRERGLYRFSPGMVTFQVDTFWNKTSVEPTNPKIRNYKGLRMRMVIEEEPEKYTINSLTLRVEPSSIQKRDRMLLFRSDTLKEHTRKQMGLSKRLLRDDHHAEFEIYESALDRINLNFLLAHIEFKPGQVYSLANERLTQQELQTFGIFRYALVRYFPNDSLKTLDVVINTKMLDRYQFKAGLEGFSQSDPILNSNLPGFGGSLVIKDKNVFRRGEKLDFSIKGDLSFYRPTESNSLSLFSEIGGEATFQFPLILLPFVDQEAMIRFNPSTSLSANYLNQHRNEFVRTIFGGNFNYSWYHDPKNLRIRSSFSPLVMNFLASQVDPGFQSAIDSLPDPALRALMQQNYRSLFSTKSEYSFTWSDYRSTRGKQTQFFNARLAFGGNIPWLIDRYVLPDGDSNDQIILGVLNPNSNSPDTTEISYGQFVKLGVEYRRQIPIGKRFDLVVRGYAGAARPIFASKIVPFDARFFSGGANSLRGWQSNTLGPGTFNRDSIGDAANDYENLISPGGELGFEGNAELRFDTGNYIELAAFTDVGNVWFWPDDNFEFEEGRLSPETLKLGWDAGMGLRLDFEIFVFRLDWGWQFYSPDVQKFVWNKGWKSLGGRRQQLNFGIGYPF